MRVVVWIVEGTWPAVVDAARAHAPADAEILLLHVTDPGTPDVARGAYAGLFGRGHRERDPGVRLEQLAATTAADLLSAAANRLGCPNTRSARVGRPEHEVITATDGAGMLIMSRDGDQSRLGPKSLGHATRFVLDHAP